jgi:hypothetical protein
VSIDTDKDEEAFGGEGKNPKRRSCPQIIADKEKQGTWDETRRRQA